MPLKTIYDSNIKKVYCPFCHWYVKDIAKRKYQHTRTYTHITNAKKQNRDPHSVIYVQ